MTLNVGSFTPLKKLLPMIKKYTHIIGYIIDLIYPKLCVCCNHRLGYYENHICIRCQIHIPRTRCENKVDNKIEKTFWGRINVVAATSLMYFNKGSDYQKLIHVLKYKKRTDIGLFLGMILGQELEQSSRFKNIDYIVPIPLHPKKLKRRGYNQCDYIAQGLSPYLNADVKSNMLERVLDNKTQTKMTRSERWLNVEGIFECSNSDNLQDKNVLLVDDVLTTGSTLEAAAIPLIQAGANIYIVTIGFAV